METDFLLTRSYLIFCCFRARHIKFELRGLTNMRNSWFLINSAVNVQNFLDPDGLFSESNLCVKSNSSRDQMIVRVSLFKFAVVSFRVRTYSVIFFLLKYIFYCFWKWKERKSLQWKAINESGPRERKNKF